MLGVDTNPWFKHPTEDTYQQGVACPPGWVPVDAAMVADARSRARRRAFEAQAVRVAARRITKRDALLAAGFTDAQADAILL